MRKYGKWLLVLGILAANPAWASADGFLNGFQSKSAQREVNQQRAEQVARALKQARLNGYDLQVEVRGNTVKLDGKVRDVNHRALADKVCQQIDGIKRVQNNLKYVPSGNVQQTAGRYTDNALRPATYNMVDGNSSGVQQVHFQKPGKRTTQKSTQAQRTNRPVPKRTGTPNRSPQVQQVQAEVAEPWQTSAPAKPRTVKTQPTLNVPQTQEIRPAAAPPAVAVAALATPQIVKPQPMPQPKVEAANPLDLTTAMLPQPSAGNNNQQVAQDIASSLEEVGLVGYNVEVRYENGVARLVGDVPSAQQVQAAGFAAKRVRGVNDVKNELKISGPVSPASFNGGYPMPQQAYQTSYAPVPMGGGMGAPMGGPSAIGGAGNYSNPQLPQHAWPAYAQYPNSAAVQYPKQHSASAFPYIGPFYPYPQVPLGWREVSLQWDDGYWQLDFEQKKDAWYWLWNPKNWH